MARRSDHSREEIRCMALQAARQLVIDQGFKGLSARKVASEIGYTVGTLYLVFKNLDDLILQLNQDTLDDLYQLLGACLQHNPNPQACVRELCHGYYRFACENQNRWLMLFEHVLPETEAIPEWYTDKVAHGFILLEQALRPLISHRTVEEIGKAARVLWGSVHGISMLAITDKLGVVGADSVNDLLDSLIDNYLAGLAR